MEVLGNERLTKEELAESSTITVFNKEEIKALYDRFTYLDRTDRGILTFTELKMLPEFDSNPLSPLILGYIESTYEGMDFASFLDFLSTFSVKTNRRMRIEYVFKILDIDRKGRIECETLEKLQEMMGGTDPEAAQRTLELYDSDKKGYLSFQDVERMYMDEEMDAKMVINFEKNVCERSRMSLLERLVPGFLKRIWNKWLAKPEDTKSE